MPDRRLAVVVSARDGVEIDFCPQCRGVWLDRGELDKIIDRAATAIAGVGPASAPDPYTAPARAPDRDDRRRPDEWSSPRDGGDRGDVRKRKRRSFLDDLFDFD